MPAHHPHSSPHHAEQGKGCTGCRKSPSGGRLAAHRPHHLQLPNTRTQCDPPGKPKGHTNTPLCLLTVSGSPHQRVWAASAKEIGPQACRAMQVALRASQGTVSLPRPSASQDASPTGLRGPAEMIKEFGPGGTRAAAGQLHRGLSEGNEEAELE